MSTLRIQQQQFLEALSKPTLSLNFLSEPQKAAIYRGSVINGWLSMLESTFPVTRSLVGATCFAQLGRHFCQTWPQHQPDIHQVGSRFPSWLLSSSILQSCPYLADMAHLEWLMHSCSLSAKLPALSKEALSQKAQLPHTVVFQLQPHLKIYGSVWPVYSIWQAHQQKSTIESIDLNSGAEQGLLFLIEQDVCARPVSQDIMLLWSLLSMGKSIESMISLLTEDSVQALGAEIALGLEKQWFQR